MRARYYDPACGRFVSEDPGRDGQNWFAYCANNPINKFDQDGKETIEQIYLLSATAAFFTGIGALLGSALMSKLDAAAVWKGAIAFFLRFFIGIGDVNYASNFDELAKDKFKEKMAWKNWSGGILGLFGGVVAGYTMGQHSAKVALELFYIDNWDVIPG